MAMTRWRCINHGGCADADCGTVLSVEASGRVACPACGSPLVQARRPASGRSTAAAIVAAMLLVAGGSWAYNHEGLAARSSDVVLAGAPRDSAAALPPTRAVLQTVMRREWCGERLRQGAELEASLLAATTLPSGVTLPAGTRIALRITEQTSIGNLVTGVRATAQHATVDGTRIPLATPDAPLAVHQDGASSDNGCVLAGSEAGFEVTGSRKEF